MSPRPRTKPLGDRIDFVPLETLELDPKNPRLPDSVRGQGQEAILLFIEQNYRPILIGRSIALHRFFVSEPLIVIQGARSKYVVVEGNRRLVALRLLTDAELRKKVKDREWDELAKQTELPSEGIPVVIARTREEIAPIIGYRHIAGIQEWEPYLSIVLQSQEGIEALRRTGNLTEAKEAARGGKARLVARLTDAQASLRAALQDIEAFKDDQGVKTLVAQCLEILTALEDLLDA
jgi:hypothetical protein